MNNTSEFLQTEEWADFQKSLGRDVFFISAHGWKAMFVKFGLPFGKNYLYCGRGPVPGDGKSSTESATEDFLSEAKKLAQEQESIFIKWDSPFEERAETKPDNAKWRLKVSKPRQPRYTVLVGLEKGEEELLRDMKEKTRYNIKLASRRGVVVRTLGAEEGIEVFWKLIKETAGREHFHSHSRSHYKKMIDVLNAESADSRGPKVHIYVAEYHDKNLSSALVLYYNGTAVYLHGASSNVRRDVMAPYAMHWQIMRDAKKEGCTVYDFWGIDEKNPRWEGFTRFKKGFGGSVRGYAPTFDMIIDGFWYSIYRLAKLVRGL
jgi:peptidoglycan pentaglycine glycine transferase (the first glycine)